MKVLLYEAMDEAGLQVMRERADISLARAVGEEEVLCDVGDVDAIILRANGAVTERIMDSAPRLKVIGRHGVGVDNIDVRAATERGIWVVNTPLANREAVAEHVVGMMLTLARRVREADSRLRRGDWDSRHRLIGVELFGRSLGIVGMGNIGSRVAEISHRAFGMDVLYCDVVPRQEAERELDARRCKLRELFAPSDFVSIHVPKSPETDGLIGSELLSLMKPTAYLINTSRGGIVDEDALACALREGKIAGAGLDVFAQEFKCDHLPLFEFENVILTPHMAAHTKEAMVRMSLVAEDVVRVLEGRDPEYPVNRPARTRLRA